MDETERPDGSAPAHQKEGSSVPEHGRSFPQEGLVSLSAVLTVTRPEAADRPAWESLFRAYIDFYERSEPQAMYDRAWEEFTHDNRLHARVAKVDGQVVGIVHFLEHPSTSSADVCYLQDLFTAPAARGQGVGRALIEAVADHARALGCARVYWQTKIDNVVARRLYDGITEDSSFIVYRLPL